MPAKKIVILGPKCTGKTSLASFLCSYFDVENEDKTKKASLKLDNYNPTAGARILELTVKNTDIELWDISGDHKYENCWKAMMADMDGCILVYNPEGPGQEQQLDDWYDFFVKKNNVDDAQCLAFAFRMSENASERFTPPPLFSKVTAALINPSSSQDVADMFQDLINSLSSPLGNYGRK
jgi:intraflagellar transport protein 22